LKNKVVENVEEKISSKVNELGFEIEYVEFVKEGDNNILRIVLDKPNGTISIDDCELVSRAVEDDIDKLVKTEYVLEVSSPGLERQLKNIKLYKKYTGENINVKLFKKNEIGKEFECILFR
jgi:ribosome maturation factor RimP